MPPYRVARAGDESLWSVAPPRLCDDRYPEHLSSMRTEGRCVEARLRGHGEYGWECKSVHDGAILRANLLGTYSLARSEADDERQRLSAERWTVVV
jgi:hypothetical protein